MARISEAEKQWRERFPYTRVETEPSGIHGMVRYTVYAGDYLCAVSIDRKRAFLTAWQDLSSGTITPDPNEQSTEA